MTARTAAPGVLEQVRKFMEERIPFNRFLGMRLDGIRAGWVKLAIPFRDELIGDPDRPALHGGVISTLVDTAGGAAAFTLIGLTDVLSTIDLRVDYLRPGRPALIAAEATVLRMGNRVASVDVKVFHPDAAEDIVATGKAVYNVKRGRVSDGPPAG